MDLIPLPQRITSRAAGFRIGARPRVGVSPPDLLGLGEVVAEMLGGEVSATGDLTLVLADPKLSGLVPAAGLTPYDWGDESYTLTTNPTGATVTASTPVGLFRGATTFAQLAEHGPDVPGVHIVDGPALRWRGLSLDVVRHFFTVEQVKRVVDLLALYKFNVLHLHLTDSQAWRLEMRCRPALTDGVDHYSQDDFREIVAYAAARFVTVVPEIDLPGHTQAAISAYPELGALDAPHELLNHLSLETASGFLAEVLGELAELTPGLYVHIGGDEAFGMPHDAYAAFLAESLRTARATGKRVVAWQEAARSKALGKDDVAQCWVGHGDAFNPVKARETVPVEYHPLLDVVAESFTLAPHDAGLAVEAGAWVLASPSSVFYLDRRYAEDSTLAEQTARRAEVGLAAYTPRTCEDLFDWVPGRLGEIPAGARLAGVEAAIWCETVSGFDDLAFLLLPRLPGIAEKAWTPYETAWDDYRARVAAHAPRWERMGWGGYYRSASLFSSNA